MTGMLALRMHDGHLPPGRGHHRAGALCLPGGVSAAQEHKLPKEVVERGPQVVAEFGNDQPDTGIRRVPAHVEDVLAGPAVGVTKDAAILIYEEGAPLGVEGCQVLVRAMQASVT